jgi:hypothetical protein
LLVPKKKDEIFEILVKKYSNNLFDGIMHLYTQKFIFEPLNNACRAELLDGLKNTLTASFSEIKQKKSLMIKKGTTLYRGVGKKFDDKELDGGIWSAFTSTSLDINVANMYAGENGTIFEI